tara:strand:- start:903 stop:1544 length:642 start_codon:yes stop_codon:yes gene_type:complete
MATFEGQAAASGSAGADEGERVTTFGEVPINSAIVDTLNYFAKIRKAITFDEVTLEDKPSDYHPSDVDLRTHVTRNISLGGCGILSAAMDTVTEGTLALALAKMGGIGIIHRNLSASEQASQVNWVRKKIHFGGMIDKPITFKSTMRVSDLESVISSYGYTFTSFPILDENNKLVGLITRDEMDFAEHRNPCLKGLYNDSLGFLEAVVEDCFH